MSHGTQQRVGAHRAPAERGWPWWAIALAAVAAVVLLTAAGVFALELARPRATAPTTPVETAQAAITDPAQIDPALDASISVLDASGEPGLAAGVGQALADAGWDVAATGGSTEQGEATVVWYDSPELEPVALGIVGALGVGEAQPSAGRISGSPITIVLGADAPGSVPSVAPSDDGDITSSPAPPAP